MEIAVWPGQCKMTALQDPFSVSACRAPAPTGAAVSHALPFPETFRSVPFSSLLPWPLSRVSPPVPPVLPPSHSSQLETLQSLPG